MSSVSSVGQTDISQLLQSLQAGQRSGKSGGAFAAQQPPAQVQQQFQAKFQSAAKELGIDTSKFADIQGKIRDSVQSTLDNNQGLSGDQLQSKIEDGVNGVLKDNGIDPDQFKSQLKQIGDKLGLPNPGQGGFPGFGASGGFGSSSGVYSANGNDTKSQLLQQLISSLGGSDSGASGFFANADNGSFINVAA